MQYTHARYRSWSNQCASLVDAPPWPEVKRLHSIVSTHASLYFCVQSLHTTLSQVFHLITRHEIIILLEFCQIFRG